MLQGPMPRCQQVPDVNWQHGGWVGPPALSGKLGPEQCWGLPPTVGILPYFWFCSWRMRPVEASVRMIQLHANSFGLPVLLPPVHHSWYFVPDALLPQV